MPRQQAPDRSIRHRPSKLCKLAEDGADFPRAERHFLSAMGRILCGNRWSASKNPQLAKRRITRALLRGAVRASHRPFRRVCRRRPLVRFSSKSWCIKRFRPRAKAVLFRSELPNITFGVFNRHHEGTHSTLSGQSEARPSSSLPALRRNLRRLRRRFCGGAPQTHDGSQPAPDDIARGRERPAAVTPILPANTATQRPSSAPRRRPTPSGTAPKMRASRHIRSGRNPSRLDCRSETVAATLFALWRVQR